MLEIIPQDNNRPEFAARVTGIDIAKGVSPVTAAIIEKAMDDYAVLVFPDQAINDEQHNADAKYRVINSKRSDHTKH